MQSAIIETPVNVEERKNLDLRPGDTVRVHQRIKEGDKTRLQMFEGLVIARKHGREAGGTFTVRKISGGIGVERIFPLYSPLLEKIEVIKRSKTRRAKLYFVRDKAVKELRKRQKQVVLETVQRVGFEEDKPVAPAEQAEPAPENIEDKKETADTTSEA